MKAKLAAISTLLLLALVGASAVAQKLGADEAKPAAEVLGFEWKYQGYASAETVRDETDTLSMKSKRGVVYVFRYTAKVSLKNLSAKTIKAVEWNYVFVDPESSKELKRYKFQSKQQIQPNESQTLTKDIFFSLKENTRHLNIGKQKILLARIEYTDGSTWRP